METFIGEACENGLGALVRSHNPKSDYDNQEEQNVENHQAILNACPDRSSPDVDNEEDQDHCEDKQSSLPSGGRVVGVVDYQKSLDDCTCEERSGSIAGLP